MLNRRKFYINGHWIDPVESFEFNVINPSTEQACAQISLGSEADTNNAVDAASKAFPAWALTSKNERLEFLTSILENYKDRSNEMADLISLEMGAPIDLSRRSQVSAGEGHIKSIIRALKGFEFVVQ